MRIRAASVYLHHNQLHIHADTMTRHGFWIAAPPFRSCPVTIDDASLGDLIVLAHHGSREHAPGQINWLASFAPLLQAAGVSSWEAFAATARPCGVATGDTCYTITRSTSGSTEQDFRRQLRRPCRLSDLGAAVRACVMESANANEPTATAAGSFTRLPQLSRAAS